MGDSIWDIQDSTNQFFDQCTVVAGTSTLKFTGTGSARSITSGGNTFNIVQVAMTSATLATSFLDALSCARLLIEPGCIVRFKEGTLTPPHTITNYTTGDWDGTLGNTVKIRSITDGAQHTLNNPIGMVMNYVDVQDSIATNDIDCYTNYANNVGETANNVKWIFALPVTALLLGHMFKRTHIRKMVGQSLVNG
jgi:hypothetical protein